MTLSQEQIAELQQKTDKAIAETGFDYFVKEITTKLGFKMVRQITIFRHADGSEIVVTKGQGEKQ